MNKAELAVKWLQEAADTGFPCYPLFERDSNLDPLGELQELSKRRYVSSFTSRSDRCVSALIGGEESYLRSD